MVSPNNIDLTDFRNWLEAKQYSKSYINVTMCYTAKYGYILNNGNLRELDMMTNNVKTSTVKSLILYSKFLGNLSAFKSKLAEYGIKLERPNSLTAFLRIMNNGNNDIIDYYYKAKSVLHPNEQLFLEYLLKSGQRVSEGILAFNLVIELAKQNKLSEYFNSELNCLMHFKYPKFFIRRTKASFVTFITPELVNRISHSNSVTYSAIRKRIERAKLKMRLNEFRDKFGTWLVSHGILEIEQNLCCGRLNSGIFVKHYWSPKLRELSDRVLKSLEGIDTQ